jgi:hypothetical protein
MAVKRVDAIDYSESARAEEKAGISKYPRPSVYMPRT